jgi:hypothetical protein
MCSKRRFLPVLYINFFQFINKFHRSLLIEDFLVQKFGTKLEIEPDLDPEPDPDLVQIVLYNDQLVN